MERDAVQLTEKIKSYFFNGELESKKAQLILKKKAKMLSITDVDLNKIITDTIESLDDGINFITELIEINLETGDEALLSDDISEINEYLTGSGFSEDECESLIHYTVTKTASNKGIDRGVSEEANVEAVFQEETEKIDPIEPVVKNSKSEELTGINENKNEQTEKLGKIEKENNQEKNLEIEETQEEKSMFDPVFVRDGTVKLSVCQESFINRIAVNYNLRFANALYNFKNALYSVNNRTKFTQTFIMNTYQKHIATFMAETFDQFIQIGLVDPTVSQTEFISLVSPRISEAVNMISEINSKANQNISEFKMYNNRKSSSTTVAFGNLGFMALVGVGNALNKGAESIGNAFRNADYSSSIDQQAYEIISEILENLADEICSNGIRLYDFYANTQDFAHSKFNEVVERRKKANSVVENIRSQNLQLTNDQKAELLLEQIYKYPHKADLYIELLNIINLTVEDKLIVLNYGLSWVAEPYEKQLLDNSIYRYNKVLYNLELKEVSKNKVSVSSLELEFLKEKYGIETFDSIEYEIMLFGQVISDIDINDYLEQTDLFKDKDVFIEYVMTAINGLELSLEEKIKSLRKLKALDLLDRFSYYKHEIDIFENRISLEETEKAEYNFIDKAKVIYDLYAEDEGETLPFGREFRPYWESDFTFGKFINDYSDFHDEYKDKYLFTCREHTWVFSPKTGFVISSKFIYSSNWDNPIELHKIKQVLSIEEEYLDSGELKKQHKIGIQYGDKIYYLITAYLEKQKLFVEFLHELIETYNPLIGIKDIQTTRSEDHETLTETISPEERINSLKQTFLKKFAEIKVKVIELGDAKYGIQESIREKKLNNFIDKYKLKYDVEIDKTTIIGYYDTTIFGKGDQGFAITKDCVYVHSLFEKGCFKFDDMIKPPELKGSYIYLYTKQKKAELSFVDRNGTKIMFEFISLLYTMKTNEIDIEAIEEK